VQIESRFPSICVLNTQERSALTPWVFLFASRSITLHARIITHAASRMYHVSRPRKSAVLENQRS
jgi:hypothetical protein